MTLLRSPIRSSIRSSIYNPLAGKWGNADPLGAWLLNATYADYDARKLDRMFQESTGQTPVAASADKVGLWLDGSQFGTKTLAQVIAGQPELSSSDLTTWTLTNVSGAAVRTATTLHYENALDRVIKAFNAGMSWPLGATVAYSVTVSGTGKCRLWALNGSGGTRVGLVVTLTATPTTYTYIFQNDSVGSGMGIGIYGDTSTSSGSPADIVVSGVSCRAVPGNHGLNGTSTQRLNLLISGGRYSLTADGTDDNLLSTYLAGAGANSILIDTDVPASLAATQVIAGMSGSATARLSIGINTSGQLCAGVGSDANTTIVGSTDWRGTRLIAALSADGSTVKLLSATGEEYSAAQNGSPTTTIPARLAANNNNGTASSFYGGGIARVILAQKALDIATFNAIRAQLLAS